MQDFGQRVAETEFCPDAKDASKQIQIKCCTQAALWAQKGPKLEQVNTSAPPFCLKRGRLPLTADNAAGFNPEITGGMMRWQAMQT